MTEEEAFIAAIDANPEEAVLRIVYADWLDERDDPRAAGMRALGMLGKSPWLRPEGTGRYCWRFQYEQDRSDQYRWQFRFEQDNLKEHRLPDPWHTLAGEWSEGTLSNRLDAAALAFSKLTPAQQAAILEDAGVLAHG